MKKILIIEDDLDIQELIQFFLEDQGYEVITASDGIDGIAVFLKEQIDLILLDILLPKMDGYAVCELIRKESEVPIIYSAEIIGIYETKQERKSIMYGDSYRPENTIFTDMSFPEKPSGNEGNPFYQYAIFKVQNAGKYDQVKKSVQKANIDWSRYDLIDNNGNIKNMTENFGQMDQMSMGLLLIVSVSGLVILVLVFLFWIKNRTQEIGIMMSLGKCKFEIWVQFLWEAVMISIIGMLLSFAISPIIAETSASYLAKETQTLRLEQQEQENTGTYIDGYIAPDLKIQDVEVHITKEMVLMDIGMISGILIIAVLVAGITIMKKRPKQILSEMS